MKFVNALWFLLTKKEKTQLPRVLLVIGLAGALELIGLSLLPILFGVIADDSLVTRSAVLTMVKTFVGAASTQEFINVFGIIVIMLLILSLLVRAYSTYELHRFAAFREHHLASSLMALYLRQPYLWHVGRNIDDMQKDIGSEVNLLVYNAYLPIMKIISHAIVVLLIFSGLLVLDTKLTVTIGLSLSGAYAVMFLISTGAIKKAGEKRHQQNTARFRVVGEAFSGVKELKSQLLESFYFERFLSASAAYARQQSIVQVLANFPRYLIEAFALCGVVALMLVMTASGSSFSETLSLLTFYAVAGYRLLPAFQQIFYSSSQIRYIIPAGFEFREEWSNLERAVDERVIVEGVRSIALTDVSFKYPGSEKLSLESISLKFRKGQTIGVVGRSGSGKSTLVDLILGLLEPTGGSIEINNQAFDGTKRFGFGNVGYVPQKVTLFDGSLVDNITVAIAEEDIDRSRLMDVLAITELRDLVENQLAEGVDSLVGQGGSQLSGGQIQRIGIARAIYKQPDLLILDEATSALDKTTEMLILDNISSMKLSCPVIQISHNIESLNHCDSIVVLKDGKLISKGSLNSLIQDGSITDLMNMET